jgi:hypothetical protein
MNGTSTWGTILKHTLNPLTLRAARRGRGPFSIVTSADRKGGKAYETPIIVQPTEGGFMIELTYGDQVQWYRNVLAAGGCNSPTRASGTTSPALNQWMPQPDSPRSRHPSAASSPCRAASTSSDSELPDRCQGDSSPNRDIANRNVTEGTEILENGCVGQRKGPHPGGCGPFR